MEDSGGGRAGDTRRTPRTMDFSGGGGPRHQFTTLILLQSAADVLTEGKRAKIYVRACGGTKKIDNRWIVPYNPVLMVKYNAHINVELVASIAGIKYLFKYINKGKI